METIRMKLDNSTESPIILIEVPSNEHQENLNHRSGLERVGLREKAVEIRDTAIENVSTLAERSLTEAIRVIPKVADKLHNEIANLTPPPQEASIDFGFKFSATGDLKIASSAAEASLSITLKWSINTVNSDQ
ncbi:CU044_2847 family protein [Glycomyces sp. NPDC047369]